MREWRGGAELAIVVKPLCIHPAPKISCLVCITETENTLGISCGKFFFGEHKKGISDIGGSVSSLSSGDQS